MVRPNFRADDPRSREPARRRGKGSALRFSRADTSSPRSTGSANKGSSARQNASPTSVVQCHGAQTRLGLRGGGRLRVLSTDAVAPPSLFASPPLPADDGGLDNSDDRLFDRRRHVAERCVSRVVELGSRKQPGDAVWRINRAPSAKHSLSRAACAASIQPLFLPAFALRGALLAASDNRVQADNRHDHP